QIMGRAARHINGRVIMYADQISKSMEEAIKETQRRREIQLEYNQKYGITPKSIKKEITDIIERKHEKTTKQKRKTINKFEEFSEVFEFIDEIKERYKNNIEELVKVLTDYMFELADKLEFEKASVVRDEIKKIEGGEIL
ncbi:MAG: UvrB/UvrC motif-containing protein, partial [Brevinematia bacterium]